MINLGNVQYHGGEINHDKFGGYLERRGGEGILSTVEMFSTMEDMIHVEDIISTVGMFPPPPRTHLSCSVPWQETIIHVSETFSARAFIMISFHIIEDSPRYRTPSKALPPPPPPPHKYTHGTEQTLYEMIFLTW